MRCGRFGDPYRGDGWFVSFRTRSGFLLVAVRWRWRFAWVVPPAKPWVRRLYVGPFEFERTRISPQGARHG